MYVACPRRNPRYLRYSCQKQLLCTSACAKVVGALGFLFPVSQGTLSNPLQHPETLIKQPHQDTPLPASARVQVSLQPLPEPQLTCSHWVLTQPCSVWVLAVWGVERPMFTCLRPGGCPQEIKSNCGLKREIIWKVYTGRLGDSAKCAILGFGSGHYLRGMRSSPVLGLWILSLPLTLQTPFPPLSLSIKKKKKSF